MRYAVQIVLIAALFVAVGVLMYRLSGAGDPLIPPTMETPQPQHPSIWLEDLPAAQAQAKAENKLILVDFQGSDWCTYCIQFHKEIADTPEFQAWAREHVVLVNVDFPRRKTQPETRAKANQALAELYGIEGFPTLLLLKPDGSVIARLGYSPGGAQRWLREVEPFIKEYRPAADPARPTVTPNTETRVEIQ